MRVLSLFRALGWALAAFGALSFVVVGALAVPLSRPPELPSIHAGAAAVSGADRPDLTRFQARDGTSLAYRLYPAANGATDRIAVVIHGSAGSSAVMNAVAHALTQNGVAAASLDMRGHGGSGTRGDIAYTGQLDDDLTDFVAELRKQFPNARLVLIGHSAGGGFALRVAGEPLGKQFDRFVLLAPYLGYTAPTNRKSEGAGRWVDVDMPRIFALLALRGIGIDWAASLPVIAFAVPPGSDKFVTPRYTFRLLTNFGPPRDWKGAFAAAPAPIDVIVGANDELMLADAYAPALAAAGSNAHVIVLPGIDHMGIVREQPALDAVVAAAKS